MSRKAFALLASALTLTATLAGCAPMGTVENPAVIGENGWEIEYVIVNPTDNIAIPCLWKDKRSVQATITCDWSSQTTSIPADSQISTVGESGWEMEYVQYQDRTIACLWNSIRSTQATRSCNYETN